jgi:heme/copper-type cytochrome/quinol oxidase subunit 2
MIMRAHTAAARMPTRASGFLPAILALFAVLVPSRAVPAPAGIPSRRAALALAREEAAVLDTSNPATFIMVGSILFAIAMVVALAFYPVITSSVKRGTTDANSTSTNNNLLNLIPTIFVIVLLVAAIGFLFVGIRGFLHA